MKNFIRAMRLFGLAMIIVLACTGLGFMGGIPIPEKRKRENIIELRTELKNEDENNEKSVFFYQQE